MILTDLNILEMFFISLYFFCVFQRIERESDWLTYVFGCSDARYLYQIRSNAPQWILYGEQA